MRIMQWVVALTLAMGMNLASAEPVAAQDAPAKKARKGKKMKTKEMREARKDAKGELREKRKGVKADLKEARESGADMK